MLSDILTWVWDNKVVLGILIVVICNRKSLWKYFVQDPITGGNGITQPDELAKWILMATYVGMTVTYPTYKWPLEMFGMNLTAVVAIAKLDKLLDLLLTFYKGKKGGMKIDDNK